jgi:hypothetical protein
MVCAVTVLLTLAVGPRASVSEQQDRADSAQPESPTARHPDAAAAPGYSLADLSWIVGHWRGQVAESVLEEFWSAPAGGAMMGMFRWVRGDKIDVYEFLTLVEENGGVTLRFKHFDAGLVSWEEKDKFLQYRVVSASPSEIVFEDPERTFPRRITYRLVGDNEAVHILEGERNGQPARMELPYKRVNRGSP